MRVDDQHVAPIAAVHPRLAVCTARSTDLVTNRGRFRTPAMIGGSKGFKSECGDDNAAKKAHTPKLRCDVSQAGPGEMVLETRAACS